MPFRFFFSSQFCTVQYVQYDSRVTQRETLRVRYLPSYLWSCRQDCLDFYFFYIHNEIHSEYGFYRRTFGHSGKLPVFLMLVYISDHVIPCVICLLGGGFPAGSGEEGSQSLSFFHVTSMCGVTLVM